MKAEAAIELTGIGKTFPSDFRVRTIRSLDQVDLEVRRGEVFGFIGHNGAGKTTLIKILTGLIQPTTGDGRILGRPLGDVSVRKDIGFLPERPYFYDYLSGEEALRFYGRLSGMSPDAIRKRSAELLEMLDLREAAKRRMRTFSKGMLQRVGMAQAILHDPHLVILDEPMSGLDPSGRGRIKDIIRMLKEQGKTVFFSTHILSDVEQLCDRMATIAQGRIWYTGTVEDLLNRYERGTRFILTDVTDEKRAVLENLPGSLSEKGRDLELSLPMETDPNVVLKRLVAEGVRVERMIPERPGLEEIFLAEGIGRKGDAA